ncbi:MAG TPA: hypothetical protein VIL35_07570, partial [Vicinamibacterales bacterium]
MITAEAQPDETAVESQAVWPWQAEPYRLWSLLEMLRFRAASFAATMAGLERATLAVGSHEHIEFVNQTNMDRVVLAKAIREAEPALEELPLSPVVKHQFQRIKRNAEGGLSREALSMLLRELQNNILVDLSSSWFLMIPAERRE